MSDSVSTDALPTRFDHLEAQPRLYKQWEEAGYFHALPDHPGDPYSIVIPPPNVTGALHLGHALNNTLQDICIRMKRMQGFNTLWMPGTDHAGIATQAVVERRLKEEEDKSRHDLGREKLVQRIWEWKDQYETRILSQLKQMGSSCDWERTRFTLDEVCARAVRRTFFDLFRQNLIYRGKRLVNWDTYLQTAVSDDEVFHETIQGHFWHIRYPVIDPLPGEPTHVAIATTRPETMLADAAVAVHPDPAAAFDKVEADLRDKLAVVSDKEKEPLQQQLDSIAERRATMLQPLVQLCEMAQAGRRLHLPLVNREIPLITDEWAKPELGSGCVKITPAHDPNDYEVWQRHPEIGAINMLNSNGTLNENAGGYQELTIPAARQRVVDDLQELDLLIEVEDREIDLAHSDRSKTAIEPLLANQWFVRMETLAQSAMDAVESGSVKIYPERYAKGYLDWLGEKRDWPGGRQVWWGHRIPSWIKPWSQADEDWLTTEYNLDSTAVDVVAAAADGRMAVLKVAASEDVDAQFLVSLPDASSELEATLESRGFVQEDEVLDTWFSSALWPHSTLGWPEQTEALARWYPTSVLITSRDIITLWVARMVLTGLNNLGEVPFRDVFIHPKILDGYGETMSKSKGNGVDPLDVIDKFGADALRFGLSYLTTETQDVRLPVQFECPNCQTLIDQTRKNRELPRIDCKSCGEPFATQWARSDADTSLPRGAVVSARFEQGRNFCNKLWNAARFAFMNLAGYSPAPVTQEALTLADRWLLSRLSTVTEQVTEAFENYRFSEAARTLYDFAWDEFCGFYVEMAKERLQDDQERDSAQRVLACALDQLLRLLHPIIPFISEELWQALGRLAAERGLDAPQLATTSIMQATWPAIQKTHQDPIIEERFSRFQEALGAVREIRSRQNVAPKKQVNFCIRCDPQEQALLAPMEPFFAAMANAVATAIGPDVTPPATHASLTRSGMEIYVDLAGLIDVEAEVTRLEKARQRIEGQIQGKQRKLANEKFVANAPADVVQRERDGLQRLEEEHASTTAALEKLSQLE